MTTDIDSSRIAVMGGSCESSFKLIVLLAPELVFLDGGYMLFVSRFACYSTCVIYEVPIPMNVRFRLPWFIIHTKSLVDSLALASHTGHHSWRTHHSTDVITDGPSTATSEFQKFVRCSSGYHLSIMQTRSPNHYALFTGRTIVEFH